MMKLILLATVFTLASAAQLPSKSYIPQGQGGNSGAGYGQYQGIQNGGYGGSGGINGNGNTRPQQQQEKNAAILKQEQDIDENGNYHHGYETENGIKAEESGNPSQAQGGFSYKGDDGIIYTITYTSGEGGFRPEGEHLPIAPPTPEAILEALQKNAEDEAKGIFDDGKYRPDAHDGSAGNSNHQNGFKPNSGYTY